MITTGENRMTQIDKYGLTENDYVVFLIGGIVMIICLILVCTGVVK